MFSLTVYSLFIKTFRHTELSLWTSHWNNGIHDWVHDAACTLNITQWGGWLKTKFWRSLLFTGQRVQIWLKDTWLAQLMMLLTEQTMGLKPGAVTESACLLVMWQQNSCGCCDFVQCLTCWSNTGCDCGVHLVTITCYPHLAELTLIQSVNFR